MLKQKSLLLDFFKDTIEIMNGVVPVRQMSISQMTLRLKIKNLGAYSQHFIFFVTYESAQ